MRKELFETGKTVDAAIDAACEKLECSRDDCEWEIIDLPKKGFLGLKNIPAKVRVSIEVPDEKPAQKPEPERQIKQVATYREQPKGDVKKEQRPAAPKQNEHKAVQLDPGEVSEKEKIAKEYLAELVEAAGLKADYTITRERGGSCINIVGDGLGLIIGRRGETLDAIQYLTGLVANRGEGDYLRLTVDCGNYRFKRKDTLEALAKKLAGQVLKTNVSKTLEPMNPFERRIIHATVSEIEGVTSSSIGEEPNRRVIITSPSAKPPSRGGYRNEHRDGERSGGYNRGGGRDRAAGGDSDRRPRPARQDGRDDRRRVSADRPPRPAAPISKGAPKQTPESEVTSGISFGKIDLE